MKIFLSHSSKDKESYLSLVVKEFSQDDIFYDQYSFLEGEKNEDEIERGIGLCDIFVVFLSNNSLSSKWVLKEMELASKRKNIKAVIPFIIDSNVKYNDPRIPEWLSPYNIKRIANPKKASRRIKEKYREIVSESTNIGFRKDTFVGRNKLTDEYETILHSEQKPVCLFCSGIPKIGRSTFTYNVLRKNSIITQYYEVPTISLDAHESIEDFLIKLNGLGLTTPNIIENLSDINLVDKIELAYSLLIEINSLQEMIMIIDDGSIVRADRTITDWFIILIDKINQLNRSFIVLISSKIPNNEYFYSRNNISSLFVPELSKFEVRNLFNALLALNNLNITNEQAKIFLNEFNGHPDQIIYAVKCIKHDGLVNSINRIHQIRNYKIESIYKIFDEISTEQSKLDIVALLSKFEFIGYEFLYKIIGESTSNYDLIDQLIGNGVIEHIGVNGEHIKLNSAIRNEALRRTFKLNESHEKKLIEQSKIVFDQLNKNEDYEISEYYFAIQEMITSKTFENVDMKYLIPSHYLKSMKELYDQKRNWKEVVILADKILEKKQNLDGTIVKEIQYYLCQALARQRDRRFEQEINDSDIKDSEKYFLKAFYNRLIGNYDFALDNIFKAFNIRENFSRAKRELVNIYLDLDDYGKARDLARENYLKDEYNNPYHIQAYFTTLIRFVHEGSEVEAELQKLLSELSNNKSETANQMYLHCRAEYIAYVEKDPKEAVNFINNIIKSKPNSRGLHYCLIDRFYFASLDKDPEVMKQSVDELKKMLGSEKRSQQYVALRKMEAIYQSLIGNIDEGVKIVNSIYHYPQSKKDALIHRLNTMNQEQ